MSKGYIINFILSHIFYGVDRFNKRMYKILIKSKSRHIRYFANFAAVYNSQVVQIFLLSTYCSGCFDRMKTWNRSSGPTFQICGYIPTSKPVQSCLFLDSQTKKEQFSFTEYSLVILVDVSESLGLAYPLVMNSIRSGDMNNNGVRILYLKIPIKSE